MDELKIGAMQAKKDAKNLRRALMAMGVLLLVLFVRHHTLISARSELRLTPGHPSHS